MACARVEEHVQLDPQRVNKPRSWVPELLVPNPNSRWGHSLRRSSVGRRKQVTHLSALPGENEGTQLDPQHNDFTPVLMRVGERRFTFAPIYLNPGQVWEERTCASWPRHVTGNECTAFPGGIASRWTWRSGSVRSREHWSLQTRNSTARHARVRVLDCAIYTERIFPLIYKFWHDADVPWKPRLGLRITPTEKLPMKELHAPTSTDLRHCPTTVHTDDDQSLQ